MVKTTMKIKEWMGGFLVHRFLGLAFLALVPLTASAQAENPTPSDSLKETRVDSTRPLLIEMDNTEWNKDPKNVDTAVLLIRDNKTNTTVKANLSETAPNSHLFRGTFTINWKAEGAFQADIYSPPQNLIQKTDGNSLENLIKMGKLAKRPYFLRSYKKDQMLTIYNTSEEALIAYSQFKSNPAKLKKTLAATPVSSNEIQNLNFLQTETIQKEFERLEQVADEQISARKASEQKEKEEQNRLAQEQERLSLAEREAQFNRAKALSEEGLALYDKNKYKEAELKFRESLNLAPLNASYYLQYGVTLYRNRKYNEALVALNMASGSDVNSREKSYFLGLCHLKLKEFAPALENFGLVTSVIDEQLTPAASFQMGVIYFTQEKYTLAKMAFEKTLDTSNDPRLDEKADSYIDQIATLLQYQEKLNNPFTANINTQFIYDSNIVLVSNAGAGSATDKEGFRGSLAADLTYRLIFKKNHEWLLQSNYSSLYSVDDKFKPSATLQMADAQLLTLAAPYRWKGTLFKRATVFNLNPGYEALTLKKDTSSQPENVLNTTFITLGTTIMTSEDIMRTFEINTRTEKAEVVTTSITNASKFSITNNNIYFLNEEKNRSFFWGLNYLKNDSDLTNLSFNRVALLLGYSSPSSKVSSWSHRLTLASNDYSESSDKRKDTNANWSSQWSRFFGKGWSYSFGAGYEVNSSTNEISTYNKYLFNSGLSWSGDF